MKKKFAVALSVVALAGIGGLLKLLSDSKNEKYSDKWFQSLSDADIATEREKVRQEYCSVGDDYSSGTVLQSLLWKFDKVIRERNQGDDTEYKYPKHREHGWYLPNDD